MYGKVGFTDERGEETEFYIIEETKINNKSYLLVTDTDDEEAEEAEAYILKDISEEESEESVYTMVDEEAELSYVSKIFSELLDDVNIE
ncbi:MAG: DUF1292 domain-containing protein [Lachnospiraceae bacterium]|nr:DUF1292 domain-containing protein [Lachnospiraceae bacterium]